MNTRIANALFGYFEALYDLNRNVIMLCGFDLEDLSRPYEKLMGNIIVAIPQLVPYVFDKATERYIISPKDGLLEYSAEIPYLQTGYEEILKKHYNFLSAIKKIRNKFEHKMHGATLKSSGKVSGRSLAGIPYSSFDMTYSVEGEEIELQSRDIINFAFDMNNLFSKLQKSVEQYAEDSEKIEYPYYQRLLRFNFADFNWIYKSDVLHLVGKSLFPF